MDKDIFIDILQRRMDKTATEQFWVVALIYGLNGVLIFKKVAIISFLNKWVIITFSLFVTIIGTVYILQRMKTYIEATKEISQLISNEKDAPDSMRHPSRWGGISPLGYGFYIFVIWVVWVATLIRYSSL
jgi:hypothetical protein